MRTPRLALPAVTLAITAFCARGLDVAPLVFVAVWAGLTLAGALLWSLWLREVVG